MPGNCYQETFYFGYSKLGNPPPQALFGIQLYKYNYTCVVYYGAIK